MKLALKNFVPVTAHGNADERFANKKVKESSSNKEKEIAKKKDESLKIFFDDAYWESLVPLEDVVEEPLNPTFKNPRAPTIEEKDGK